MSFIVNAIFLLIAAITSITGFILLLFSFHRYRWHSYQDEQLKEKKKKNDQQKEKSQNNNSSSSSSLLSAAVIVCGDIARSPRMQYHAVSLCNMKSTFQKVYVVGANMNNSCCEALEQQKTTGRAIFHLVEEDKRTQQQQQNQNQQEGTKQSWVSRVIDRVLSLFFVYFQAIRLVFSEPTLSVVLVQTPPVIPTLPIIALCAFLENLKRSIKNVFDFFGGGSKNKTNISPPLRIIFDVHNLGWTILKVEKRPKLFVNIYRFVEFLFVSSGMFCDARITVSEALGDYLKGNVDNNIDGGEKEQQQQKRNSSSSSSSVVVLPDSAPEFFRPSSRKEFFDNVLSSSPPKIEFGSFGNNLPLSWYLELNENENKNTNLQFVETRNLSPPRFNSISNNNNNNSQASSSSSKNNNNNNLVVAASTSWTADDDYTVVVDALCILRDAMNNNNTNNNNNEKKNFWLFVSGKGPSRQIFEDQIKAKNLLLLDDSSSSSKSSNSITVTTGYFQKFSHYALFLGAADLGLCLHHSSSGLDLPMKGVDMFGCGLPVAALEYQPALPELVSEKTGFLFRDAKSLAKIWIDLLGLDENQKSSSSTSTTRTELLEKREQVQSQRKFWSQSWQERVEPLVERMTH